MSGGQDVVMPQLGQAMEFGVLTAWKVADGATIAVGEVIALVESDKASYDIEASSAGTLVHRVAEGAEVAVGDAIATIGSVGAAAPDGPIGSAGVEVTMPQLGQAMEFGTVTEWLISDCAPVIRGQAIASVVTDKANYEI